MNFKTIACTVATCATLLLVTSAAHAQSPTSAEAKCRSSIAKSITKYQSGLWKTITGCVKSRTGGKLEPNSNTKNCNILNAANADLKGKLDKARTKAKDGISKACSAAPTVIALFPRCPSPAETADDPGGIDNAADLGKCLVALSDAYVERIAAQAYGNPTYPMSTPVATCQNAIGKPLGAAMAAFGKVRSKCQGTADKGHNGLNYSCATFDDGSIAEAEAALNAAINTSCAGEATTLNPTPAVSLVSMGACGQTAAQLKTCINDRMVKRVGGGLVAMAYELPAGNCAGYADVIINAGFGTQDTDTKLDSGYSGLAHGVDVEDGYIGGVTLSGCDGDCKNCAVTLDAHPVGFTGAGYSTCRCDNDSSIACNTIEAADAACSGNTCHCMFGPPLPLSAGNAPACVVNRFAAQFTGTTGAVGEYDVNTRTNALVHLGISATKPCPICIGDVTANDANRQGTCSGGVRNGLACDINANSPDFGNVSFDCLPAPAQNISGTGIKLGLVFSDGTQTLTGNITNPAQCTAGSCPCGECSGDNTVGCTSNADCSAVAAGTCTATVHTSQQNQCSALDCSDDGTGTNEGECGIATPVVNFCSAQLRKNGHGYLTCSNNADCAALNSSCTGGNCGTCGTVQEIRKCFLSTVTASGTPGIFGSNGIATFCSAATSNVGINSAGGLPGPGRVVLDFDFNLYCSDHTTKFDLPGGSNCP